MLDLAAHRSALAYKGSLVPRGRYLYVGESAATLLQVLLLELLLGRAEGKSSDSSPFDSVPSAWGPLVAYCQAGKIATVLDRRNRLRGLPEALRYIGEGHAKGKLVATLV
jgi:NADPH:quinone reductase-like Zn-dependent oxidoreductase